MLKDVKLGNSLESNMVLEVLYGFVLLFDPQLITPGLELIPPLKSVVFGIDKEEFSKNLETISERFKKYGVVLKPKSVNSA